MLDIPALLALCGTILAESWAALVAAAPFMLLGFVAAGLLKGFLPEGLVSKHLSGRGVKPIFLASVVGVPLPL